jgi:colicin import membrane protein
MITWLDKTKAVLVTGTVHGAIIGFMLLSFNWNTAKLSAGGPPPTIQARVIDPKLVAAELANLKAIEQQRLQAEQQHQQALDDAARQARKEREQEQQRVEQLIQEQERLEQANKQAKADVKKQQELAQQAEQQTQQAETAARELAETQRKAEAKRKADVKRKAEAKRKADAKRKAETKRKAEKKRRAEAKRKAEKKRKAEAKHKAAKKRKAEARRKAAAKRKAEAKREAARRRMAAELEAEENARRQQQALQAMALKIKNKVGNNWRRPPGSTTAPVCTVTVSLKSGGQVTGVSTSNCGSDRQYRRSVENAVLKSSPLPLPKDATLRKQLIREGLQFKFSP